VQIYGFFSFYKTLRGINMKKNGIKLNNPLNHHNNLVCLIEIAIFVKVKKNYKFNNPDPIA